MNDQNLGSYLNNHLAGSVAGIELVKRALAENRLSELGGWLERFLAEMEEDRETIRRILHAIGRSEDMVKKLGGWALEKVAATRLDDFTGRSPHLRRVVELEGILIGTHGRLGLWRLLERFLREDSRVAFANFSFLRQRAEGQSRELERFREEEAAAAFAD